MCPDLFARIFCSMCFARVRQQQLVISHLTKKLWGVMLKHRKLDTTQGTTVDGCEMHATHHPRNPRRNPQRKYQQAMVLTMVSKWCRILSIHSSIKPGATLPCFLLLLSNSDTPIRIHTVWAGLLNAVASDGGSCFSGWLLRLFEGK